MEFLFSKSQAYKLQPFAFPVFEIPENSWDDYCGIPFYRFRHLQIIYRRAVLKSFWENSLKGLQA